MNHPIWLRSATLVGLALLVVGCSTLLRKEAPRTEQLLMEAGFRMKPAQTPEQLGHLQALPPFKLVKQTKDGRVVYRYADPGQCQCVYVGGIEEYETYKRYLDQKNIAQEYQLEAVMATEEQAQALDTWAPLW
ncbi:MAG: hypothetical protein HY268_03090 [Deltaproteobacteria bacterium]|nr:hypothetical protein [Deltaproteobacteria bacterium]